MEIVQYLFSKNAQDPQKALVEALEKKHTDIVEFLIGTESVDVNQCALSFSPYFKNSGVSFEESIQTVRELTGHKLNSPFLLFLVPPENYQRTIDYFSINRTDETDSLGRTVLHIAAMRNNVDLVRFLLENNIEVNAVDNYNHTALFYCITSFGPKINWEKPIIEDEKNARINYISSMPQYWNPVEYRMRGALIGNMLLNADIDVNIQNGAGWSVLHFSSASFPRGPFETLIERGANRELKTNFKRTADDIIAMRK